MEGLGRQSQGFLGIDPKSLVFPGAVVALGKGSYILVQMVCTLQIL